MTRTVHVFDRTVHEAHDWVNELTGRLGWSSERDALRLLRTVLCKIRDHLPVNEMAQFSAQLPIMLRGMFFEGWQPKKTPVQERHAKDFIAAIEEQVGDVLDYRGAMDITATFTVINARISRGEVEDVRANLPQELRDLWPEP
ncbi:DUF2267 domain-containing protein [Yoonia sp.]|uniref:DUF2267 domain-containing protein n=1 Tax=Yoonia sp. TaxID=2212373 RepID=UPI0025EBAA77|nr:DUF2267 domain-containing protein [Yoonia sp.]